jgi:hypothetical protein
VGNVPYDISALKNNTTTQQHNNTTTQQHNNTTTQQHNNTTTEEAAQAANAVATMAPPSSSREQL